MMCAHKQIASEVCQPGDGAGSVLVAAQRFRINYRCGRATNDNIPLSPPVQKSP
jgi:hypothetical protein